MNNSTEHYTSDELLVSDKLLNLYDQMIGETDIPTVLRQAADAIQEALGCERATIYLVRKETQELESAAIIGNVMQAIKIPILPQSLAGFCALNGRAFVVPDAYGDLSQVDPALAFDRSWDQKNKFRTKDVMCAPSIFRGEVRGVVQVINKNNGTFAQEKLRPPDRMARFVAYSLYHAQMYNELETMKCLKREKARFMRVLVHELKSPAAGAKMMVSTLEFVNQENQDMLKTLSKIGTRMDTMLTMVEDILHLSKINEGDPLGEVKAINLCEAIQAGCDQYRDQAENKELDFIIELPPDPVPIRFDVKACDLVISNLVSNAVKYTATGHVKVSLNVQDRHAVMQIEDTGMGIPKEDIPEMFKEFFRASNAKGSDIKGTGVGLAGIKELIDRFGGTIGFESEQGKGSTFEVKLPVLN